jgi:CheY-like chemotaxis protein
MDSDASGRSDSKSFGAYKNARRLLVGGMVMGLVLPAVYAVQAGSIVQFVSVTSVGLVVVAASLTLGGLLGFIFGIPRFLQEGRPTSPDEDTTEDAKNNRHAPYAGNTSLEQISDWLTKILIGVGLTQLANIPGALADLGDSVAVGLGGFPGAAIFIPGLVVFALLDGFFLGYLWTRLYLPSLFAESDVRALIASAKQEGVEQGEQNVIRASSTAAEVRPPESVKTTRTRLKALWVDDRPANNRNEIQWMGNLLGIQFETKTSTDEAIEALTANPNEYTLVISDMGRPGDPRAGYTLLEQMKERGIRVPFIIYAGSGAAAHDEEARSRGALGITNRPTRLLELVTEAIKGQAGPRQG